MLMTEPRLPCTDKRLKHSIVRVRHKNSVQRKLVAMPTSMTLLGRSMYTWITTNIALKFR